MKSDIITVEKLGCLCVITCTWLLSNFRTEPEGKLEHGLENPRDRAAVQLNLVILDPCREHCRVLNRNPHRPFNPKSQYIL
jgi:hypothetical protein